MMLPKRFRIYKNGENIGKHQSMDLEWNGTGGCQKHWSRENVRVWKDVRKVWETSETSECGIGKCQKHQSTE